MGHGLNYNEKTNQYSAFTATDKNGRPWHGLGQMVDGALTWKEAIKKANMDWEVSKRILYTSEGVALPAWGMFRDDNDKFLGTVGKAFTPVQNIQMGEHIDRIIQDTDAHYESAGVLKDGQKVWALARIPEDIRVGEDITESYLMCTQGHDGSLSYMLKYTGVRVVCNNTLTQSLSSEGDFIKIRHTSNAMNRLNASIDYSKGVRRTIANISEKFNELALRKIDKKLSRDIMARVFGEDWSESKQKKDNAFEIARLFEENDNNAFPEQRGTAYNLLNACTNWSDHHRKVKNGNKEELEIVRSRSALFGTGEAWKQKALDTIMEVTQYAPRKMVSTSVATSSLNNILDAVSTD